MLTTQPLGPLLARQHGAVTLDQLRAVGFVGRQPRLLYAQGWTSPSRGVFVEPSPSDPFLAGLSAALLASPGAVACRTSAARVHQLWGLPRWSPAEVPQILLPEGIKRPQRNGMRTHYGLPRGEMVRRHGLAVTTLDRTVRQVAIGSTLKAEDLVCVVDCALRLGWRPAPGLVARLRKALSLADRRSESALETRLRLILVMAGLPPEALQFQLFTVDGHCYARLDIAWPSRRVAVEADGRAVHDAPYALYRDRVRQNVLEVDGWTVLRFTWYDVIHRPAWVISTVRRALAA
jgi:very-short-patch-repair endonuclease